jgi:hypothetical protein
MEYKQCIKSKSVKGLLALSFFFSFFALLGTGHSAPLKSTCKTEVLATKASKNKKIISVDTVRTYFSPKSSPTCCALINFKNILQNHNRLAIIALDNAKRSIFSFTSKENSPHVFLLITYPSEASDLA